MQVELCLDGMKIPLGNNGFTLRISTPSKRHVGALTIGRAKVTWRKTRWRTGQSITLEQLLNRLEEMHAQEAPGDEAA